MNPYNVLNHNNISIEDFKPDKDFKTYSDIDRNLIENKLSDRYRKNITTLFMIRSEVQNAMSSKSNIHRTIRRSITSNNTNSNYYIIDIIKGEN